MTIEMDRLKALTFDTGGTVLDWHSGFRDGFAAAGARHGITRDWGQLANEMRRRSLKLMWELTPDRVPRYTFDDAHRDACKAIIADEGLAAFDDTDLHNIAYAGVHALSAWADVSGAIDRLRQKFLCTPLTVLSYRIVTDTARKNGINWDAVFACQGIGYMKPHARVYQAGAHYLQLDPSECLMVACHNFDLNAAAEVGFQTAFVERPEEWGGEPSPELAPSTSHLVIARDFNDLADQLGCP